jgi:hypothetical protein
MLAQHHTAHAASDQAAGAARFRLRPAPRDWRDLYLRRRKPDLWAGWGVSGLLHVAMLLALAAALLPLDLGESCALLVEMSLAPEEEPLATFAMLPEAGEEEPGESGRLEEVLLKDLADELSAELAAATGGGAQQQQDDDRERASPGKRGGPDGDAGPKAEYFGTVAYGDRFVYILDMSGSMNECSGRKSNRFDRAVAELNSSVGRLRDDQWFYVILFSDKTRRVFDETSPLPQMVKATAENKLALRRWLSMIQPSGDTDPRDALYLAFQMRPSAIFLLSDGKFNGHKHRHKCSVLRGNPKVDEVIAQNNTAGSPIHSFAYEVRDARERMNSLAKQTGGVYRFIPEPGEPEETGAPAVIVHDRPPQPPAQTTPPSVPPEKRALQLLQLARTMESAGKPDKALERYREVAREFPNTVAGGEARGHAERLAPTDKKVL